MGLSSEQCKELERMESAKIGIIECGDHNIFLATYRGGIRSYDDNVYRTLSLECAVNLATQPGDEVWALDGKYWPPHHKISQIDDIISYAPIVMKNYHGREGKPVVIKGKDICADTKPILCGSNAAVPVYPDNPDSSHFAFFKIIDSEWVTIDGFNVESCWPCFVYIENSKHITIRNIHAIDCEYMVFANGDGCSDIIIEDNDWRQDPSGALWSHLFWKDMHGEEGSPWDYSYLNGALFGSVQITGNVIIRRNTVKDAFNAIRMKGHGENGIKKQNINVQIYENHFERIRDNAVEPEKTAFNWYVYHNTFKNVHAPFSFDRVSGGYWFIFANFGWFTERHGQLVDENTGGKILKFSRKGPFPDYPVFIFNNSWYTRVKLAKKGTTNYLTHVNNAIQVCNPDEYGGCICKEIDCLVGPEFKGLSIDDGNCYDYDLTNASLHLLKMNDQEDKGLEIEDFRFRNPINGDLVLNDSWIDLRCYDLVLKGNDDWLGDYDWKLSYNNPEPKYGAYQKKGLVKGPPFVKYES